MIQTQFLARQVRRVAWGYLLIYFHFKLNGWDILADFFGWLLFWKAIRGLREERPKLSLLEHFCAVLGLWSVVEWLPMLELPDWLGSVTLVLRLMSIYFHFQLLTELAELALRYQGRMPDNKDHGRRILLARGAVTVLQTAMTLLTALPLPEVVMEFAAVAMLLAQLGCCLFAMVELFSLAKTLERMAPSGAERTL